MKTIKFLATIVLSAVVSMSIAFALADTLTGFAAITIFGGLFVALAMGVFDIRESTRYQSIKHRMGIKKAA